MTIAEMREKRAKLWQDAKNFLDSHRKDGVLSAEDDATYTKMENDIVALGKEIEREERLQNITNTLRMPTSDPILNVPTNGNVKKGRASKEYTDSFWNAMFNRPLTNALEAGTDSEGGYLVPDEFDNNLVQALLDANVMRKLAKIIRTASGEHKIPIVSSHGTAAWLDEEASYTESDDAFTQKSLGAHKVGRIIKVSDELMSDSAFNLQSYLASEFGRSIGAAEETAFVSGDGSGKPLGITDSTNGAATGVTTASATAITGDELLDLYYSVKEAYRRNSAWLLKDSTVKMIRKLKDGNGQYLWQPGLTAGSTDTLLGKALHTSDAMAEVAASARTILFGDFSYYWIADRGTRTFKRLNELYAASGQVGFIGSQRVDGKLILSEAVKTMIQHA